MKRLIVLLLMLTLVLCGCSKGGDTSAPEASDAFTPPENYASVVLITINPQFRLYLDINGQVLAVEPVNDDAKSIADKVTTGDLETVVDKIATAVKDKGFVTETVTVDIQITEVKDTSVDTAALLEKAESSAVDSFQKLEIEAEVNTSVSPELPDVDVPVPSDPSDPTVPDTSQPSTGDSTCAHNYTSAVTAPTKTTQGYTTHTCGACGHSYKDTYTNLDGTTYTSGTIVFCPDGVARLYGSNNEITKTYTGWIATTYQSMSGDKTDAPWFKDRKSIIKVVIMDGVSPVSTNYWFYKCENLTDFTIGNGVTSLGERTFSYCTKLASITIPDHVTSTRLETFSYCKKLTSIALGNGMTTIGERTFQSCQKLTSINWGNSVTTIGPLAFFHCYNLPNITIPSSVKAIGDQAFTMCESFTEITIPDTVTSMGGGIFNYCIKLKTVTLPNCEYNGFGMFTGCSSLINVTIPSTVTSISPSAFKGCTSLTSITIPRKVEYIFDYAFQNCTSLETIKFEGSVSQWEAIKHNSNWRDNVPATHVQCTDGTVDLP